MDGVEPTPFPVGTDPAVCLQSLRSRAELLIQIDDQPRKSIDFAPELPPAGKEDSAKKLTQKSHPLSSDAVEIRRV